MFFFTEKKMAHYKRIGYNYEYPLDHTKYFVLICVGACLGGFANGFFAVGQSTTIIFFLLYLGIEPIVATATVGFQVVFGAAASLIQAIATDKIPLSVVGFFFAITFIGGGVLSYVVQQFLKNLEKNKVNKILIGIIGCLTCCSSISMGVNTALEFHMFGREFMLAPGISC